MSATRAAGSLPALSSGTLLLLIISGSVATIAFDIWGQVISPWFLSWANLSPTGLAQSLGGSVLGLEGRALRGFGHLMHLFLVGIIAYPVGWLFIFRPLQERFVPQLHWFIASAIYGFGLFLFAIGIIAGPLVANVANGGWFLNWTGITWVAMIGHTLYGIVCAWIVRILERHGIG